MAIVDMLSKSKRLFEVAVVVMVAIGDGIFWSVLEVDAAGSESKI
jgi:hypothetical protein